MSEGPTRRDEVREAGRSHRNLVVLGKECDLTLSAMRAKEF